MYKFLQRNVKNDTFQVKKYENAYFFVIDCEISSPFFSYAKNTALLKATKRCRLVFFVPSAGVPLPFLKER